MLITLAGLLIPPDRDGVPGRRVASCGNVKLRWLVCNRNRDTPSEQQGRNGDFVER
jgi:hypothetical protein